MYSGKNKTALYSQSIIADAFIKLLKEKNYSDISVSLICKTAMVSRQTFYSVFETKENVIYYELNKKYAFDPDKKCSTHASLQDICKAYSIYINNEKEFIRLLVKNDIMYFLKRNLYSNFIECSCFLSDKDENDKIYSADFIASALTGIAEIYVENNSDEPVSHLENIMYKLFSGEMFL